MSEASRDGATGTLSVQAWPSRGWSLRTLLVLLVAVSVVPLLALGLAAQYVNYRQDRTDAGQRALELSRSMALMVGRELQADIAALEVLALSPALRNGDIAAFRARAEAVVVQYLPGSNILLLTADGQQVMNTALPPGAALPVRRSQENMREVFATGQPRVSDLYYGLVVRRPVVAIEVPVKREDGSVAYSLALNPTVDAFAEVTRRQRPREGWVASIVDRQGVHIARTPNGERSIGQKLGPELLARVLSEREGVLETTSLEGIPLLSAFSRVEPYGWSVAIGVPRAEYAAPASRWLLLTLGIGGTLLVLALALAAIVARRITGPIAALRQLAAAEDDLSDMRATGLRETDELAQALVRYISERQRAQHQLSQLNETLERRIAQAIADREATQAQLAQSQKMEAVGQLTGGIAHDFNNLLTSVIGSLDVICSRVHEDELIGNLAATALRAAERGAELTSQLLAFGRRQVLRPENVDVRHAVADMRALIERALGETIRLDMSADADVWPCHVDKAQFDSAILNLALNARDAMPNGGVLTITASNVRIGPRDAAKLDLTPGDYVRTTVSDTGTGMSPEARERAFEPFFTTKGTGKGTGLGLSQVYGFAKQSGGTAAIESKPGEGTGVSLFLPKAKAGPLDDRQAGRRPEMPPRTASGKNILIVEDEAELLDVVETMLRELGYGTRVARDATEAMTVLASESPTDLLFSDVVLPGGTSGIELARMARRLRPDVKVLLTSGYPGREWTEQGGLDDIEVLPKPYRQQELAERLHRLLGAHCSAADGLA